MRGIARIGPLFAHRPKKGNFCRRFKPNLDQLAGNLMPFILTSYTFGFGVFQLHGFHFSFYPDYLIILLPLWLIDGLRGLYEAFIHRSYRADCEELDKLSVVIACKDGEEVIGGTLKDLRRRFSGQRIIVASNGSTDRTCEIAREYGVVCLDIKAPIGKVRAINYALDHVQTPYVLLLDDDTIIGDALLPTGLLDQGYGAVAFRVYVKTSTWITQLQAYEYIKSSDTGKRRHNKAATVQNVSGAIGMFHRNELVRQIELHTGEFSGEDLQRTLLVHLASKRKGVVLAHSIVYTTPPNTFMQLYRQRVFGWFPGLYSNFKNYIRLGLRKHVPLAQREDAFYNSVLVVLLDVVRVLSLPVAIFYPWYFIIMYLAYVSIETIAYLRHDNKEIPYWVILFYPFYGLFGLFVRLSAFATFLYRRIVAKMGHLIFLDDYRQVRPVVKLFGVGFTVLPIIVIFVLNIFFNYSAIFTNPHF
jgi:cellulose synthase/poly-beta-1,6-N-acetylglucosamine synthase-like glycosyltransferase